MKYIVIGLLVLALCASAVGQGTEPTMPPNVFAKNNLGVYNVKSYGAVGDSITDDRAAIQSAIDACIAAGGGTVWFPPGGGTYRIADSMLQIRKGSENVRLFGNGARIITDDATALWAGGMLTANGDSVNICRNIEITGFVFEDHLKDSAYNNATGCSWSENVWIHNNYIKRASRKGISSHWSNNVFIYNNIIDSVGYAGIVIEHSFGLDGSGDTIFTNKNVIVADNIIRWIDTLLTDSIEDGSFTSGKGVGIAITNQGSSKPYMKDIIVRDNIILSHQNRFIHLAYVNNAIVSGNIFDTSITNTFDIMGSGTVRLYSTDSTEHNDSARITFRHYDWTEEDILLASGWSDNGNSRVDIGGGVGQYNAVEEVRIFTGIGDVATTGNERISIDSLGTFFRGEGHVYFGDVNHTGRYFYLYFFDEGGYGKWMRFDTADGNFRFSHDLVLNSGLTIGAGSPSTDYAFPTTDGTAGQVIQTAGDGTTSWQDDAGAGGGEANTLGDTGTFNGTEGFGLAGGKTGTVLKVKGLIEGSNITIAASGDSAYTITGPAGSGTADSMRIDTGTGVDYLYQTGSYSASFKEGAGINLSVSGEEVTISNLFPPLGYFTEADDNDTSVFTATGPNTTVGFNDNLTMQSNDITGVGLISFIAADNQSVILTPSGTGGFTLTLPPNDGDNGQQLTSDGSGVMTWEAAGTVATDIVMDTIAAPTFSTVQQMQNVFHSVGWTTGGAFTDTTDGAGDVDSLYIAAGTGLIRTSDIAADTNTIFFFDWGDTTIEIPADTVLFIGVKYNAGTPVVFQTTADKTLLDHQQNFELGTVTNETGVLHITFNPHAIGDHATLMIERTQGTMGIQRDNDIGGLILGEKETRHLTVTAGTLFSKLNSFSISAIDLFVSGSMDRYYRAAGSGFTKEAAVTQWNNTQYDDGDGGLATINNNKYAVQWFYVELDGTLISMYGRAEYNILAVAESEPPPSTVPLRLTASQATLIGRIIFQESAGTASEIQSVFTTTFAATAAQDHGNLAGLSDDDHTQYLLRSEFPDSLNNVTGDITISGGTAANTAQAIVGDDVDSTAEAFVFSSAYHVTSAEGDSIFVSKKYVDDAAGGLTDQSVKGNHVDSVGEDFVFNDAYRITSAEADSAYMTKKYIDDAAGGLTDQSVKGDHVDSVGENFVFDGAFHITSAESDSAYVTAASISDTGDILRNEMQDTAVVTLSGSVAGNTETGIAVSWQSGDSTMDYIVAADIVNHTLDSAEVMVLWRDTVATTQETILKIVSDSASLDTVVVANALTIPSAANPTTGADGRLAWDSDDNALEVYNGSNSMLISALRKMEALIWNPDLITDTVSIYYVDSVLHPGGIEIVRAEVQMSEDAGAGTYELEFMYFTAADPPVLSDFIDTLIVAENDSRVQSITFENSTIAIGQQVYILTPSDDIDWIRVSLLYYVKEND